MLIYRKVVCLEHNWRLGESEEKDKMDIEQENISRNKYVWFMTSAESTTPSSSSSTSILTPSQSISALNESKNLMESYQYLTNVFAFMETPPLEINLKKKDSTNTNTSDNHQS